MTVVPVLAQTVPVYGQYVGQTEAVQTVEVRARVEGFLDRQAVPDGADITAGDVLFVIDPRPFRVALNDATAQLARDEARLANARQVAARYRPLYERQAVSRQELEQAEADERAAAATVDASRAAVEQAELNLGYTTVRSPVTGRMGRPEVRVGSLVGKGEATLLATVSTLDPMYVFLGSLYVNDFNAFGRVWRVQLQAEPGYRTTPSDAARLRFRPILMTSVAFILGSFPLVVATGAGAASRLSIGTTVVGRMLAVTVLCVLLVPAFYVAVERLAEWRQATPRRPVAHGAASASGDGAGPSRSDPSLTGVASSDDAAAPTRTHA